ncbi:MAG: PD-(D/E)XK nuclease family protein [Actinomycetia bacterium]|nr:PD-(D/E)XK nuclease family protein [Actinomycetes bacterium]
MKIKCPLCGCENYFTGLEDEGTKFCSECNTPLIEPKTMLGKETFCPYCGIELIEEYKGKYKCPSCNRGFIKSPSEIIESTNLEEGGNEIYKPEINATQLTKKIKSVSDRFTNVPIDKRISISKIKDSRCPFKYYKNYIEEPKKEKPFLSIELGLGQFFHSKVEWLFKGIASQNRKITSENILKIDNVINEFEMSFLWNGQLRVPYKIIRGYHFNHFKNRLDNAIKNFNGYVIPRLLGHKVVKTEGGLQIRTDDFVIRGKYDLITQDQNNRLILWDWKTGRMPKPDFYEEFTLQKIQLGIYAIWIRYKYETDNVITNVVFLRDNVDYLEEVFDYYLEEKVLNFVENQYDILKNITEYTPIPNNLCPWCSWNSECGYE